MELKKKMSGIKIKRKWVILTVVFVAVIGAGSFVAAKTLSKTGEAAAYTEYTVSKGDISVTISGSSTIEPIHSYTITALVEGDVTEDTFEEGDKVEKDQLLYVIDPSDAENTIQRAEISMQKSNLSYKNSADDVNSLTITSPISGKLSDISIKKGENVQSGQIIATVYDYSSMTLKVPFNVNDVGSLRAGQSVSITVENTFEVLSGKITKIYNAERIVDGSVPVTDVEISITNPGSLISGTYASAEAGGISSYAGGALDYTKVKNVTAGVSGTVEEIYCTSGEYVNSGAKIAKLSSDSVVSQYESSALSLKDAQLSYENTRKQLENYHITAPIAGTVISKSVKAGDIIESGSSSSNSNMAVIADMSTMICTIEVDELDIVKMKTGQSVSITADAYSDKIFTGHVDNIGLLGTANNGVTTYPVRIVVDDPDGDLWPGMNVNADIVVESASNVLYIPVAAVNRGNLVLAKGESNVESGDTDKNSTSTNGVSTNQTEMKVVFASSNGELGTFPEGGARPERPSGAAFEGGERPDFANAPTGAGMRTSGGGMRNRATDGSIQAGGDEAPDFGGSMPSSEGAMTMPNAASGGGFNPSGNNRTVRIPDLPEGVPPGFNYRMVTLGINDSNYIEVTGGLSEGDIILVPAAAQTDAATNNFGMQGGGMMVMQGAPPQGGNMGGGNQQRNNGGGQTRQGGGF